MRTAPVRAGSIGATPAFHGQRGLDGEPVANRYRPKTIANRQTDRPGIRRRGICRCGANPRREDRFLQADRPADRHARPRPPRRPCHGLRPGRAPCHRVVNSAGRTAPAGRSNGNCSKRKAFASRPTAAPTSSASCGRKSYNPHRTCPTTGTRIGSCDGKSTGNPAGKGICPRRIRSPGRPRQHIAGKIWHSAPKPLSSHHPHTLRAYCGGQYSPPGMRLSGKSTA